MLGGSIEVETSNKRRAKWLHEGRRSTGLKMEGSPKTRRESDCATSHASVGVAKGATIALGTPPPRRSTARWGGALAPLRICPVGRGPKPLRAPPGREHPQPRPAPHLGRPVRALPTLKDVNRKRPKLGGFRPEMLTKVGEWW